MIYSLIQEHKINLRAKTKLIKQYSLWKKYNFTNSLNATSLTSRHSLSSAPADNSITAILFLV